MRKIKLLILFAMLVSLKINAQTFRIDTSEVSFENKLRPCLLVKYDASAKTVKKGWADYLKRNHSIKVKGIGLLTDKDIVDAEDVTINSIADKRMNMYARVSDLPAGSEMKFFVSFGYDFFIGPENYGNEFGAMHKLLNDFSINFLNDFYSDEASSMLKQIKGYENDIKKNNKEAGRNTNKANKGSDAVASGYEAKNKALALENKQIEEKIEKLKKEMEMIKVKQDGIVAH
jgi:cell division protein FtsB